MWIFASLATIVVGAILKFGVSDRLDGMDLQSIGVIVMAAGAVGFLLALAGEVMARRSTVDREVQGPDGQYIERERRTL